MIHCSKTFVLLTVAALTCCHPQPWSEERKGSYQHKRVQHGHGGSGIVEQRSGSYQHSIRGEGQPKGSHQFSGSSFDGSGGGLTFPSEHLMSGEGGSWSSNHNEEIVASPISSSAGFGHQEVQGSKLVMSGFGPVVYQGGFKSHRGSSEQRVQVKGAKLILGPTKNYQIGPEVFESASHREDNIFKSPYGSNEQEDLAAHGSKLVLHQEEHHQIETGNTGSSGFLLSGGDKQIVQEIRSAARPDLSGPEVFDSTGHHESSIFESRTEDNNRRNLRGNEKKLTVLQIEKHQTEDESYRSGDEKDRNLLKYPQVENEKSIKTLQHSTLVVHQEKHHKQEQPISFEGAYHDNSEIEPRLITGRGDKQTQTSTTEYNLDGQHEESGTLEILEGQKNTKPKSYSTHELHYSTSEMKPLLHQTIDRQSGSENFERDSLLKTVFDSNPDTPDERNQQNRGSKVVVHRVEHYQSSPKYESVRNYEPLSFFNKSVKIEHEVLGQRKSIPLNLGTIVHKKNTSDDLEYVRQQGNRLVDRLIEQLQNGSNSFRSVTNDGSTTISRSIEQPQEGKLVIRRTEHYQSVPGSVDTGMKSGKLVSLHGVLEQGQQEHGLHKTEVHQVQQEERRSERLELVGQQENNQFKYPIESSRLGQVGGGDHERQQTILHEVTSMTEQQVQPEEPRISGYQSSSVVTTPGKNRSQRRKQGSKSVIKKSEFHQTEYGDVETIGDQGSSNLRIINPASPSGDDLTVHTSQYHQSGFGSLGTDGEVLPSTEYNRPRNQGIRESKVIVQNTEYRQRGSSNLRTSGTDKPEFPIDINDLASHGIQGSRVVIQKSEIKQEGSGNIGNIGYQRILSPVDIVRSGIQGAEGSKVVVHESKYRQSSGDVGSLGYQGSSGSPVQSFEQSRGNKIVVQSSGFQQGGDGSTGGLGYQRSSSMFSPIKFDVPSSNVNQFSTHRSEFQQTGSADIGSLSRLLTPISSDQGGQGTQGRRVVIHTSEIRQDGSGGIGTSGFQRNSEVFSPVRMGGLENQGGNVVVHRSEYHQSDSGSDGTLGRLLSPIGSSGSVPQSFQTMQRSEYHQAGSGGFGTFGYRRSSGFSGGSRSQEYSGGQRRSWTVQQVGQHPGDYGSGHQQGSMLDLLQEGGCQGEDQEQYQLQGFK
ncbi:uncharacterized protein LOC124362489 [Homalodisca vitripennis]|uniref:uncharacterized protein LOC124362489 n=1 Tax=Homalodisca vitripennis TaxID=197043 RepID=UPI001EEBA240|nr:uncharacterized protein LOC124362489 [Homalodisca vitripennis]